MSSVSPSILITVIVGTIILIAAVAFIISFLLIYQKKQLANVQEKERLRDLYDRELLRIQLEIQEQTLQQIGRDIHDNVGQILAVVRLYLKGLSDHPTEEARNSRISATDELVGQAINDLRNLSHSLSSERLQLIGLSKGLRTETERIGTIGKLKTHFSLEGKETKIEPEKELILFRMCQEALTNAIRHSDAEKLELKMHCLDNSLHLSICDNGNGFDINEKKSNGLLNLQRRAEMIGAVLEIKSNAGNGTEVHIELQV
jgi:signal transduction histidine kinase